MKSVDLHTHPIFLEKDEDGFYVAINSALTGCYSQGRTPEEALVNLKEATELCLAEEPVVRFDTGRKK